MSLLVPLPSPTSFPTPTVAQKQTLFPAFLGAPYYSHSLFHGIPIVLYIPHVLPNAPIVPHCILSPFLPFILFCCHSCCLITIHVLLSPYLSFSLSHRLVTILIVSIAMSPFSLCPWLFLSSHCHCHCLVINLAILRFYCPCEIQTRTTPNHNVPLQSRFGTCSLFWNGPWTSIKCVPQGERLFW